MIAADTSSLIAYFTGQRGSDVRAVDFFFEHKQIVLPPVVLCEILSNPKLPVEIQKLFKKIPVLEVTKGYWQRAGMCRSKLLSKNVKARLADTLIAQSCIDYDLPLITRDSDFLHFKKLGLKLFTKE